MSCCDGWDATPEDTVGECPVCEGEVDIDGESTEAGCAYSPVECSTCNWKPCDQSC